MRKHASSATAELIAQGAVFLAGQSASSQLLSPGAAELSRLFLEKVAPFKLRVTRLSSQRLLRPLASRLERLLVPGLLAHYALRKRFINDAVESFCGEGGKQLVVIGAGLDTLATRIALAYPEVLCVELDHPATQEGKRRALEERAPPNLQLEPVDLTEVELEKALSRVPALQAGAPTFFVFEGVSMYLDEALVRRALATFARFGGRGSKVAWTYMRPDEKGRLGFRRSAQKWVDAWLAWKSEPFTWGIARERLGLFLEELGLRVVEVADAEVFRARYLTPKGLEVTLAEGEESCLCEKA